MRGDRPRLRFSPTHVSLWATRRTIRAETHGLIGWMIGPGTPDRARDGQPVGISLILLPPCHYAWKRSINKAACTESPIDCGVGKCLN
jgi:hypothetical protein